MKTLTLVGLVIFALTLYSTTVSSEFLQCIQCGDCKDDDEPRSIECPFWTACLKVVQKDTNKIYRDCGKSALKDKNGACGVNVLIRRERVVGCVYTCDDDHNCNAAPSSLSSSGQWKMLTAAVVLLFSFSSFLN